MVDSTRPDRTCSPGRLRTGSPSQTSQRVRVGALGLGVVALLIAVAAAMFGAVARERPASAPGGAKAEIVANMASGNAVAGSASLSDMGVAPGIGNTVSAGR